MNSLTRYICSRLIRFWWKSYKRRKDKRLAALKKAQEEAERKAALKKA